MWGLALLVVVAGGLRVGVIEAVFPVAPVGDERHYVDTATHLALGHGHRSALRNAVAATPPLHPLLLSIAIDPTAPPVDLGDPAPRRHADRYVDPERLKPLLYVQAAVGTLAVAFTALLAGALFGPRAGWLAGAVAAVHPELVAYSHYLWATSLFTALLAAGLWSAWRARESGSLGWTLVSGLVFGLAALTREVAALVAVACAVLWVLGAGAGQRARAARRAVLLLAVLVVCVTPWTLRNAGQLGRFVPVSEIGWMGLAEGNLGAGPTRADALRVRRFHQRYFAIDDEGARTDFARREALRSIAAAQPFWLAHKLVHNGAALFGPDSFLFKKLDRGAYGEVPPAVSRALLVAGVGSHALVGSFALIGIAAAPPPVALFGLATVSVVTAVHVVANASSRYRVPLTPLLIAFAAYGFLACRRGVTFGPARRLVCRGALLVFWVGGSVAFARDFVALWSTGHYAPIPW